MESILVFFVIIICLFIFYEISMIISRLMATKRLNLSVNTAVNEVEALLGMLSCPDFEALDHARDSLDVVKKKAMDKRNLITKSRNPISLLLLYKNELHVDQLYSKEMVKIKGLQAEKEKERAVQICGDLLSALANQDDKQGEINDKQGETDAK